MPPGSVEWELNQSREFKEEREAEVRLAEIRVARHEREHETRSA
jgi:hypothetical protein